MLNKLLGAGATRAGICAAALALTSCSAFETNTLVIGYSGPLTGGGAEYGQNVVSGLEMAIQEVNAAGGIQVEDQTYELELKTRDDAYDPERTESNVRELSEKHDAPLIFIPHMGGIRAAQQFNSEGEDKFLIAAYSSDPRVLRARDPLTVMLPPRFNLYFMPFARTMLDQHGVRLGLLPGTHTYAQQWKEGFADTWRSIGGEVLSDHSLDYNDPANVDEKVSDALAEDPSVLLVGGPSEPTARLIETAREQGFDGGFVVADQAKLEEIERLIPREMLDGSVGLMPLVQLPNEGAKRVVESYREHVGDPEATPSSEVGLNYEGLHVIVRAMELAGSVRNVHAIRDRIPVAARTLDDRFKPYSTSGLTARGQLKGAVVAAHLVGGTYRSLNIPEPFE